MKNGFDNTVSTLLGDMPPELHGAYLRNGHTPFTKHGVESAMRAVPGVVDARALRVRPFVVCIRLKLKIWCYLPIIRKRVVARARIVADYIRAAGVEVMVELAAPWGRP